MCETSTLPAVRAVLRWFGNGDVAERCHPGRPWQPDAGVSWMVVAADASTPLRGSGVQMRSRRRTVAMCRVELLDW